MGKEIQSGILIDWKKFGNGYRYSSSNKCDQSWMRPGLIKLVDDSLGFCDISDNVLRRSILHIENISVYEGIIEDSYEYKTRRLVRYQIVIEWIDGFEIRLRLRDDDGKGKNLRAAKDWANKLAR